MFSEFFIRRPRFAAVISLVIMIAGVICAFRLPVRQYPEVAPPKVEIWTSWPGANAQSLMQSVGVPIEEAVNGVDDMLYMSSSANNSGYYDLSVTFRVGTDSDMAMVRVQNRIQQAMASLPKEVNEEGMHVESTFSNLLGFVALVSPNSTHDELFLTNYAAKNVQKTLSRIRGMGNVGVIGAAYAIRIWLDPERLASLGLSAEDVISAIDAQNKQAALGSTGTSPAYDSNSHMVYSLITKGRLSDVGDFENIVLKNDGGRLILLGDVARVEIGADDYIMSSHLRGKPCALLTLSEGTNGNAIDIMNDVRAAIKDMEKALPEDTEFVIFYDTTEFVQASMREILETLVLTFTLVVLVCYVFLQDWRVTLVPAAAIPVSLLAAFIGLSAMGYSINLFTLFGLVLVIGTVVDDAICVVERVMYLMEHGITDSKAATVQAMKDVGSSLIATTLIFVAIFVPVAFMGGITGQIYKQFAATMSFAVCCSTLVAFTLSPAMCALMLRNVKPKTRGLFGELAWFNRLLAASTEGFARVSLWLAKSSLVILVCFVCVSAASWYILGEIPVQFIPDEDQGAVMGGIRLPDGTPKAKTHEFMNRIMPDVVSNDGIYSYAAVEGFSFLDDDGENIGMFMVTMKDFEDRDITQDDLIEILDEKLSVYSADGDITVFAQPAISELAITSGVDLIIQSRAEDNPEKLASLTGKIADMLNGNPEVLYASSSFSVDSPHVYVEFDRMKAQAMGVSIGSVFDILHAYFGTYYVNDVTLDSQKSKVIIQSDWPFRDSPDSLSRIYVPGAEGRQIPLSTFATFREMKAPRSVSRFNLYPSATVNIILNPEYSSSQGMELAERIAGEVLPEGYIYTWSGQAYFQQETAGEFGLVIWMAVVFGFLCLVAQYESWSAPLAVMMSLPPAVLGALIGLIVIYIPISIYTQLGMLLLVGLASKNAILIVEFAKEQSEVHGASVMEAAGIAARERFRSVLMTALTCMLGVMPMVFASGAGAQSRIHVGTVMFFGMGAATLVGVFLIPGLFVMMQRLRERIHGEASDYEDDDEDDYE
ncbi:MAG: efflux RND transporter permease subunit [Synergistaceae bacterium]|nr:efflux RND transporter permease subunit [Synergistaceae bacterium]